MNNTKDLSKIAPVSPRERVAGFALLPRTIDKCRATIAGTAGEYHYDCGFDKKMFAWKGIDAATLKSYIAEGHTNEEIGSWVKTNGTPKTDAEIQQWSDDLMTYKLEGDGAAWLQGMNKKLGLPEDAPLIDMLEADDKASFK